MFDISFGELLICAIVALLVLGPERLPGTVRTVGRWVGRARHTVNQFTDQIDREIRAEELKRRIDEEMKKAGVKDLGHEVDTVSRQVKDALNAPLPLVGADHLRDAAAAQPAAPTPAATPTSVADAPAGTGTADPTQGGTPGDQTTTIPAVAGTPQTTSSDKAS